MKEISHLGKESISQPLQMIILVLSTILLDFAISLGKLRGKVVQRKNCVDCIDNMFILKIEIRYS